MTDLMLLVFHAGPWVLPIIFLFYSQKRLKYRILFLFLSFALSFLIFFAFILIQKLIISLIANSIDLNLNNLLGAEESKMKKLISYTTPVVFMIPIFYLITNWLSLNIIAKKYFKN